MENKFFELNKNISPKIFKFKDGEFTFWEAREGDKILIFRVRKDTTAGKRAVEKGLPRGINLVHAEEANIKAWLESHQDYELIE